MHWFQLTKYLQKFEVVLGHIWDAKKEKGNVGEVLEGVGQKKLMTLALHDFAHQYILTNISLMLPWLE